VFTRLFDPISSGWPVNCLNGGVRSLTIKTMSKLFKQCPIIEEILVGRTAITLKGEKISVHSDIGLAHAEALYETVLRTRPAVVIEIGMAFGVASLSILTALKEINQGGKLLSVDPLQTPDWNGCGLMSISRAGLKNWHEMHEDFDYRVLPRLLESGLKLDFAYIDGWHTFDYTLLDWWYVDKMLKPGGIAVFNDCAWPAVDKAIKFVISHRKYTEIEVGIPRQRQRKKKLASAVSLGMVKAPLDGRDRYFKKDADWEPKWDFYAPF
jgi:predicted O-methyltransferase YrrM